MNEQSKSAKRRFNDGFFHLHAFAGNGIDVGCGPDPLSRYVGVFAKMTSCRGWDLKDGDAQLLASVPDNFYDFLHSAHCLEHLHDPAVGLLNWVRVVKPGGWLTVTVPDFDLYEGGVWPSRFNGDHKWKFTLSRPHQSDDRLLNVLAWLVNLNPPATVERLQLIRDFWQDALAGTDQTLLPNTESCIEIILRKRQ